MEVTRTSPRTGIETTLDINVTPEQIKAWEGGEYAQVAFKHISADEREFIMSGLTAEDWEAMFPEGEED